MILTYHGKQFFKMQFGDVVLALNPIAKDSKHSAGVSRFGADIAMISLSHPDYNGIDTVAYGEKIPFLIDGPGSYEYKGITVEGRMVPAAKDGKDYMNTVYFLTLDSIDICFLGYLSSKEIPGEVREAVENVDIVFVPLDGIDPVNAYKIAISLEPKIIIPMDYEGNKDALKIFMKEGGETKIEPLDKLTIKKKDLLGKEGDIIVLAS